MISRQEAMVLVEARINQPDMDWPTKPKQVVFDELTEESPDGWRFFYGIPEEMRIPGRDPEPGENPPWFVDKETGELRLSGG